MANPGCSDDELAIATCSGHGNELSTSDVSNQLCLKRTFIDKVENLTINLIRDDDYLEAEKQGEGEGESDDGEDDDEIHDEKCYQLQRKERESFLRYMGSFLYNRLFGIDYTTEFQNHLRAYYEKVTLARITWLDEENDKLIKDYYTKLEMIDSKEKKILLENILESDDGSKLTRILVEGQPGYGKTTLSNKIAYDWSSGAQYLQRFKLCLLQPLRFLRKRSIEKGIEAIAENCGCHNFKEAMKIVEQNASSTLLILDGLDELSAESRSNIVKVLYKSQLFKETTVIATSRTGLFNLEREELQDIYGGVAMKSKFYQKSISILGIAPENRVTFLEKFMKTDNAEKVSKQIENLTSQLSELFATPLFLALLGIMIENKQNIESMTTRTKLYKNLVNFTIRRSSERNEKFLPDDFNLFNLQQVNTKPYRIDFYQFGREAMRKLLTNDFQFECNSENYKIYEYGFLINNRILLPFQSRKHFEPFHLSIMEFAAAYFMWTDFILNECEFSDRLLRDFKAIICLSGGTSLLPVFLVGLLNERVREFFNQCTPFAYVFSTDPYMFWQIIKECHVEANIENVIIPFLPFFTHKLPPADSLTNFQSKAVELLLRNNRINPFHNENLINWSVSGDLTLPRFSIMKHYVYKISETLKKFSNVISVEEWLQRHKNIKCVQLDFGFENSSKMLGGLPGPSTTDDALRKSNEVEKYDKEELVYIKHYFDLFSTIKAQNRTLYIPSDINYMEWMKDFTKGAHNDLIIDLYVELSVEKDCLEFVKFLLQKYRVRSLELKQKFIDIFFHLNTLIPYLSNSTDLVSLSLQNIYIHKRMSRVDLNELTRNGEKRWKCLKFKNIELQCDAEKLKKPVRVDYLEIFNNFSDETKKALYNISCNVLSCDSLLLYNFIEKFNEWQGFANITVVTVVLSDNLFVRLRQIWSKLTIFTQLQTLRVQIKNAFRFSEMVATGKQLDFVVQLCANLKLICLINNLKVVSTILDNLFVNQPYSEYCKSKLTCIDVIINPVNATLEKEYEYCDCLVDVAKKLMEYLTHRLIDVVNIVVFPSPRSDEFHSGLFLTRLVQRNIFDESKFDIVNTFYQYFSHSNYNYSPYFEDDDRMSEYLGEELTPCLSLTNSLRITLRSDK